MYSTREWAIYERRIVTPLNRSRVNFITKHFDEKIVPTTSTKNRYKTAFIFTWRSIIITPKTVILEQLLKFWFKFVLKFKKLRIIEPNNKEKKIDTVGYGVEDRVERKFVGNRLIPRTSVILDFNRTVE